METPSNLDFKLDQTFFGFKSTHRPELHSKLFDLIWLGSGRWNWDDVYHLPIPLRSLWIQKLNKLHDGDNEDSTNTKKKKLSSKK
jgi:hypothetical protein